MLRDWMCWLVVQVDAELQKRRQFLQMRQEEREYNRMMYGKTENPHVDEVLSMGNQVNTLKTQVATSFNMVFTVVATCGMAYFLASQIGFGHTQVGVLRAIGGREEKTVALVESRFAFKLLVLNISVLQFP